MKRGRSIVHLVKRGRMVERALGKDSEKRGSGSGPATYLLSDLKHLALPG